jgi:hypothetical protein
MNPKSDKKQRKEEREALLARRNRGYDNENPTTHKDMKTTENDPSQRLSGSTKQNKQQKWEAQEAALPGGPLEHTSDHENTEYDTVDSEDPTHEKYEFEQSQLEKQTRKSNTKETPSPKGSDNTSLSQPDTEFPKQLHQTPDPTDKTSPNNRRPTTPNQPTDWQVVSASKRKAKSSPGKNQNSPELRKATYPRAIKKLFHSTCDSVPGEAGPKK